MKNGNHKSYNISPFILCPYFNNQRYQLSIVFECESVCNLSCIFIHVDVNTIPSMNENSGLSHSTRLNFF